ncbi:MAG: hypothetical protein AB4040_19505 [Synechococcus sp.]
MHSLKFRRHSYQPARTSTSPVQGQERRDIYIAIMQILSVGVLSGLCCFTGLRLLMLVMQS